MKSLKIKMLEYMHAEGLADSTKEKYAETYDKIFSEVGELSGRENHFWVEYICKIDNLLYRNYVRSVILKACRDVLGENLRIPYTKVPIRIQDTYSLDEVIRIFSHIKYPRHIAIASLLYTEGFRVGEIVSIKLCDCSWAQGYIIIRDTKNNNDYKKFLDASTIDKIKNYLVSEKRTPAKYLFEGQFGGQYTESSIQQFMTKAILASGLQVKGGCTRVFRRSNATYKIEHGWSPRHIAESLNNTESTVNKYYALVRPEYLKTLQKPIV